MKKLMIALLFFTTSCELFIEPMPKSWHWGMKPRPLSGVKNFPATDTEYGIGFKDGCETAWMALSKGMLSDIRGKGFDPVMGAKSDDYNEGYGDGSEHCAYLLDWDVL
jgi:hypothetical protein